MTVVARKIMTTKDVEQWFERIGLAEYMHIAHLYNINGEGPRLIDLRHEHLKAMGMDRCHDRKIFLRYIGSDVEYRTQFNHLKVINDIAHIHWIRENKPTGKQLVHWLKAESDVIKMMEAAVDYSL
jgi:hypothetical protein